MLNASDATEQEKTLSNEPFPVPTGDPSTHEPSTVQRALAIRERAIAAFLGILVGISILQAIIYRPEESSTHVLPAVFVVDINTATEAELNLLPGVGPKLASDIVRYRNEHNGFQSLDELKNIRGIKDMRYQAIAHHLTLAPCPAPKNEPNTD